MTSNEALNVLLPAALQAVSQCALFRKEEAVPFCQKCSWASRHICQVVRDLFRENPEMFGQETVILPSVQ